MSGVFNLEGFAKALKTREKGYSVKVNGNWYSGFGQPKFEKGDTISFEWQYSEDGQWRNINKINDVKTKPAFTPASKGVDSAAMLTSYAKDQVLAIINKAGDQLVGDLSVIWSEAAKNVLETYKTMQEELAK